jgi:hypothetical protein
MLEYHANAYIKFIVLEGTGRMFLKNHIGESVLVHAGQMLIVNPNAKVIPDPVDIDLDAWYTSTVTDFEAFEQRPDWREIPQLNQNQRHLVETNLAIFGRGNHGGIAQLTESCVIDQGKSNQRTEISAASRHDTDPTMTPAPS